MRVSVVFVAAIFAAGVGSARAQYNETWDDPGDQQNGWLWDSDSQGVYSPMVWSPNGGVGDSGHVATDIGDLRVDIFGLDESYANWLEPGPGQAVNLFHKTVMIDLKLDAGSNMDGASVHFYAMRASNYFYHLQPLAPGVDAWATAVLPIGDGAGPWAVLSADPSASPVDVLGNPDEYGFILLPMGSSTSGTLRFDNFVSPEPTSLVLLGVGGLVMLRRRRAV